MKAAVRRLSRAILARLSKKQALWLAIERGDDVAARAALCAGASPNASGVKGVTPLILATSLGHAEIVRTLLERGADPAQSTSDGCIAYDFARHLGDVTLEEILRAAARPGSAAPSTGGPHPCSSAVCRDLAHFLDEANLVLPRRGWEVLRKTMIDSLGPSAASAVEQALKDTQHRVLFEQIFASEAHATAHFARDGFLSVRSPMMLGSYDVEMAKRRGLDLTELFAEKYRATDELLWRLLPDSVFRRPPTRACEIGGAWGATIQHVMCRFAIESYHNYEPDSHYAEWATERFGVEAMPVDGETLSGTADDSVDLVIANNVLTFVPPIKIWSYLTEMRRVLRKDGIALFNLVLSDQLGEADLRRYLDMYFPKRTIQVFSRDILDRTFPSECFEIVSIADREYVVLRRTR
ncbi:MAG: methyltransferase domain-containing protein [Deltaproteobacteria bacterium]|nr:methyltransferase domain-containing protein [Deltaproteobacteria bacterium]